MRLKSKEGIYIHFNILKIMKINNLNFGKVQSVFFVLFAISIIVISGCNIPNVPIKPGDEIKSSPLPTFDSCSDLTAQFKESAENLRIQGGYGGPQMLKDSAIAGAESAQADSSAPSYSGTNIQVQGVDEADIIKTDGNYIYTVSYGELSIIRAFPAEEAKKIGSLKLKDFEPSEMFIDNDKVMLFGYSTYQPKEPMPYTREGNQGEVAQKIMAPDYYYPVSSYTTVKLIDTSDKEDPKIVRSVDFEGNYLTSRKIDDMVYFVINSYPRFYGYAEELQQNMKDSDIIPLYRDLKGSSLQNQEDVDFEPAVKCGNIAYFEPFYPSSYITIASISIEDEDKEINKKVIVGSGQNVYASEDNLYVAEINYPMYYGPMPLVRDSNDNNSEDEFVEKTTIYKFGLADGDIKFTGKMNAPGHILNQFSMDEFSENFRIATTIGEVSRTGEDTSRNNVYVFGGDLKMKGKLEDLAPGEKIYSSRFIGKRAYLVTFKKVDPFFVIDLSNPENPKVLGKLKIPGYSDYLHPFDEDHIIGVGKEAVDAKQGDFAWYQGMKMAIFDVTDVENPKELHKVVIGDRGTDSEVLYNHKAFLFDRQKQLLVLPIRLAEIKNKEDSDNRPVIMQEWPEYGEYTFQGAYVYKINLEEGFKLQGRITHFDDDTIQKMGYYFDDQYTVKRSLYIDNNLYTMSNRKLLINELGDLELIKELEISKGYEQIYPKYGIEETAVEQVDTSTVTPKS